jgi:hypothetical protein
MTDPTELPAPKKPLKKILILAGAGVGGLLLLVGVSVVLVMKVPKLHGLWCSKAGLFCAKELPPPPPPPKPPGGCPDFRLEATLVGRQPTEPSSLITADVAGKISINKGGWFASGDSSVSCFDGLFLASFTGMSQSITYQCVGAVDGKSFTGVCNLSQGGANDITGDFIPKDPGAGKEQGPSKELAKEPGPSKEAEK